MGKIMVNHDSKYILRLKVDLILMSWPAEFCICMCIEAPKQILPPVKILYIFHFQIWIRIFKWTWDLE